MTATHRWQIQSLRGRSRHHGTTHAAQAARGASDEDGLALCAELRVLGVNGGINVTMKRLGGLEIRGESIRVHLDWSLGECRALQKWQ